MKEFTSEEIQQKFEQLPKAVQEALTSTDVNDKIEEIGKRRGLMIDQLGELVDVIGLVMLGLEKSSNFTTNLVERLGIDKSTADAIAKDVNTEIFSTIRQALRERQEQAEEEAKISEETSETLLDRHTDQFLVTPSIPDNLPKNEDPGVYTLDKDPLPNINKIREDTPSQPKVHVDPLYDHLISAPVAMPEKKIDTSLSKNDPYREPLD